MVGVGTDPAMLGAVTAIGIVVLTEVEAPPRGRGRGWAKLDELEGFATASGREVEAELGSRLNLVACCELGKGGGRTKREFDRAVVEVTGDPADEVSVVAGRKHPYRVVVRGVRPWDPARSATVWTAEQLAGHTRLVLSGNTFDHKDRIHDLGGMWEPEARWWVYPIEDAATATAVATELERLGVTVTPG